MFKCIIMPAGGKRTKEPPGRPDEDTEGIKNDYKS